MDSIFTSMKPAVGLSSHQFCVMLGTKAGTSGPNQAANKLTETL